MATGCKRWKPQETGGALRCPRWARFGSYPGVMAVVDRRDTDRRDTSRFGAEGSTTAHGGQNGRRGVASRLTRTERPYAGRSREERSVGRHERLMAAGMDLFGTRGYARTSIEALCRASQVTPRYFYESFSSREEVLAQLHDRLGKDLLASVSGAVEPLDPGDVVVTTAGACSAFFHTMLDDPRIARIICVESVGVNSEIEQRRRDQLHEVTGVLLRLTMAAGERDRPSTRVQTVARAVVAGFYDVAVDYLAGSIGMSLDDIGTEMASLLHDAVQGASTRQSKAPARQRSRARPSQTTG
jgi:AcrR family transcriptional regulator